MPEEEKTDSENSGTEAAEAAGKGQQLEGGAYEIIRNRLNVQATELRSRLGKLNAERQGVFGAVEPSLIATERVSTVHACTPRDMIAIGQNRFLFGYNVQFGLKSTTELADVFSAYQYDPEAKTFSDIGIELLNQGSFAEDFGYLYKYYRETTFVKFRKIGPHLFMAFRVGKSVEDVKCFKWLIRDGALEYIGNRFDHEYVFPPQQEFEWVRAHRGMYREGMHPHISIEDRLFVETVGGDLTIKVEDNTESGEGIYEEKVDNDDQTLDDAEVFYATVGSLILLKILPYQEKHYRYLVYNEKVRSVTRIDSIANSCVLLPEDHGIIFSDGYHLQTGETKRFESGLTNMLFERRIASPNGEDYLYAFYNRKSGTYVLMSYNLIGQTVETPTICNGYSVFPDGEMVYFRADEEPQKHHVLQVWRTPFMEGEFRVAEQTDSYLYKVGNADIVRCMAECYEVLNLLGKDDTFADLYLDLTKKAGAISDAYFWVGHDAAFDLKSVLDEIRGAADAAIAEFDKVKRLRHSTAEETKRVSENARRLASKGRNTRPDDILGFVHSLAELREVRGEIISLRDLRYVDLAAVEALENEVVDATGFVSEHCVEFLLQPEALDPYREQVESQEQRIAEIGKVTEADEVGEALDQAATELEMLIDIVSNLKIADSTQTTEIIDNISTIYATLNRVRSALKNRRKELARAEGVAQFGAQLKLINQAVINYLDLCDTPDKCDEYLSKTMVQLEELEGRVADFDEYVEQLIEKRDEVYNAFEAKKLSLVEARNKRSASLAKSADRVLVTIGHRLEGLETINEINGYLAGDLMVEKVRDVIAQLTELGDTVKADEIQTRLKTQREDAVRQLKDRQELYVDGKNIIQLGNHRFSVNQQELELSMVPREGEMALHLAGTNYFEVVRDEDFLSTREVWDQEIVSENDEVYRGEFLAWQWLIDSESRGNGELDAWLEKDAEGRLAEVQQFMAPRYREGYTKGVHDHDGTAILGELASIHRQAGLLRFGPVERAIGLLYQASWKEGEGDSDKTRLVKKLQSFGLMRSSFAGDAIPSSYLSEIREGLAAFVAMHDDALRELRTADLDLAAEYLFLELIDDTDMVIAPRAADLLKQYQHTLTAKRLEKDFMGALLQLEGDIVGQYELACDWIEGSHPVESDRQPYLLEAAVHLVRDEFELMAVKHVETAAEVEGLHGEHSLIQQGRYEFDYQRFTRKLRRFCAEAVPRFQTYGTKKVELIEDRRQAMRLDEFKPKVMSAFVRNRLLDRIYLPLIGDNLAKQIGTAGDDTRTDRMGMLLLISPPGYGKTTLMEYVSNRLGLTFMKINGPAIGHDVKSLDPEDAPNASAREEISKLNFALEMGDNLMLYLDDIQHTHPEFLQKFISLCDAQRKIEGVWNGQPKTYDLRGKKVCVVMAGNPYTESGGKFQIPDMLANRADTYNLGDIIGGHGGDFEASYIENSLTSNPILAKLASRSQQDVYAVMKIAESGTREGVDFEGNYSMEEIEELVSVMKKLMRVRDTILRVNLEYIRSAAMEDDYRTEPAFRLQGSYRNMNRIAEKILPIMTDEEVVGTIFDHYENEAQTLTTGAEANLLKFRELEGVLTEEETERWEEIKRTFNRNLLMGGGGEDDPVSRVVGTIGGLSAGIDRIEDVLSKAAEHQARPATLADVTVEKLETLIGDLRAVPVNVEIKVVPVHQGEDDKPAEPAPKKKAGAAARKKRISGKETNLPVDVESSVKQVSEDAAPPKKRKPKS